MCFSKTIFRLKETFMFMALASTLVVLFYCHATADILTKPLQQCILFFIDVVIPGQKLGEGLYDHWSSRQSYSDLGRY